MEHTKLLVDGRWVNRGTVDEPKWELMVYPVVTKLDESGQVVGSFLLEQVLAPTMLPASSLNKMLSKAEPNKDVTLHNFGEYCCDEGYEWQLFLMVKVPYIKDHGLKAQAQEGYMYLDMFKPTKHTDSLDRWVWTRLSSLTGPRTITFEPHT